MIRRKHRGQAQRLFTGPAVRCHSPSPQSHPASHGTRRTIALLAIVWLLSIEEILEAGVSAHLFYFHS
jgi:hypothetical protein